MTSAIRQLHAIVAWLVVVAILVQVWLAGSAIPQLGGNGSFATHIDVGYSIGLVILALLVLAIAARAGRGRIGQAAVLLVLYVIQISLPSMDPGLPAAAALHPVNALLLFGLATWYARQAWRERGNALVAA